MAGYKGNEFSGAMDPTGLAVPAWPRPLTRAKDRLRAEMLSGDPTGARGYDPTKSTWHGGNRDDVVRLQSLLESQLELDQAIADIWN